MTESEYIIYLIFPILGAIFGALLWLNYFDKIDLFEKEKTSDLIIAFTIGYLTPTLALWLYFTQEISGFNFKGTFINDLIYSILGIGLTEELTKLFGVIIALKLVKKRLNEPIDYLIVGGVVALGFSIRENFIYYSNYGSQIITGRTFISCLVHIINTSMCVYGIYRTKLFGKGNTYINSIVAVSMAVVSHGLFDFFLTMKIGGIYTPFLSTLVYLIGINFWIQMFNNAINFSPFFKYEKTISSTKLYITIIGWYTIIGFLEFFFLYYYANFNYAVTSTIKNFLNEGILLLIVAFRASRLELNKRKYIPVKLQLPIQITKNHDEDINLFGILPIKIRGGNKYEFLFFNLMEKQLWLYPVNKQSVLFQNHTLCRLLKKIYLKNGVVCFILETESEHSKTKYILKPTKKSLFTLHKLYPTGMLYQFHNELENSELLQKTELSELSAIEAVYLKKAEKIKR